MNRAVAIRRKEKFMESAGEKKNVPMAGFIFRIMAD
jgi:hypothetical protein